MSEEKEKEIGSLKIGGCEYSVIEKGEEIELVGVSCDTNKNKIKGDKLIEKIFGSNRIIYTPLKMKKEVEPKEEEETK